MKLLLVAVVLFGVLCLSTSFQFIEKVEATVRLGDNGEVNVTSVKKLNDDGTETSNLAMVNVHQNENTSVVAGKAFIYWTSGSLYFLQHGGGRLINFTMGSKNFSFDPNRMFTELGRKKTLQEYSTYTKDAADQIAVLAETLLRVYGFANRTNIIAIHNNSPYYTALEYLPGGESAAEAKAVYIRDGSNPRYFFFVTESKHYDFLKSVDINVVLQADPTGGLTDDGSFSVYTSMHSKPYINVEAAAEGGDEGTSVIMQMDMFARMGEMLESEKLFITRINWAYVGPLIGTSGLSIICIVIAILAIRKAKKGNQNTIYM